jgi:hypothetical protein
VVKAQWSLLRKLYADKGRLCLFAIVYRAMGMAQGVEAHLVRVVSGNSGEEIVDLAGCRAALRLLDHVPLRS